MFGMMPTLYRALDSPEARLRRAKDHEAKWDLERPTLCPGREARASQNLQTLEGAPQRS